MLLLLALGIASVLLLASCSSMRKKERKPRCNPRAKISLDGLQGDQQTHETIDACPGIIVQLVGEGQTLDVEQITSMAVGVTTTSSYQIVRAPSGLFTQEQRDLIKDADSFSVTDIRVIYGNVASIDSACVSERDIQGEHRVRGTLRILFPITREPWPDPMEGMPQEDEEQQPQYERYDPSRDYRPGQRSKDYEPPTDDEG